MNNEISGLGMLFWGEQAITHHAAAGDDGIQYPTVLVHSPECTIAARLCHRPCNLKQNESFPRNCVLLMYHLISMANTAAKLCTVP